jgi:hypothetical protein
MSFPLFLQVKYIHSSSFSTLLREFDKRYNPIVYYKYMCEIMCHWQVITEKPPPAPGALLSTLIDITDSDPNSPCIDCALSGDNIINKCPIGKGTRVEVKDGKIVGFIEEPKKSKRFWFF